MREKAKMAEYEYNKVPNYENKPVITVEEDAPPKYGYGVRHIQLALFLLCLTVNIVIRGHMGVTIVAMTSQYDDNTNSSNPIAHLTEENTTHLKKVYGEENELIEDFTIPDKIEDITIVNTTEVGHKTWDWPKSIQEMVLNSFFIGYMIMMFPMGMVCQRYGGKLPLQIALFVNGIASIATPWITIWGGWKGLCCSRVLQGLTQAGTYPSIQGLLAKWVPAEERATMGCCVHTGLTVGTVIAFQLAGFLGASKWGWPSTFYTIGVICLLTFILLTIFGAATPMDHKTITDEERNYIMGAANNGNNKKQKTPWKAIFTSRPLWGTIITHIGSNIAFVFFFNQVPTYIHHTLGIDVKNSGLLSSLPYVASFFTILGFGWLSDYCTNKNIVSKNNARRISNSIGNFGLVGCLLLTSYTDNTAVVITCLVIAMAANMGINTGWMVNYIDLAPNFGGTLTATGNTVSNVFVVLTPIVVSHVVTDMSDVMQWRIMFFITAGVSIVANAIFLLLLSTDIQPWNYPSWNESCVEDSKKELKATKKKSCDLS